MFPWKTASLKMNISTKFYTQLFKKTWFTISAYSHAYNTLPSTIYSSRQNVLEQIQFPTGKTEKVSVQLKK